MDCRLPQSSIHGIFQARVLEWVAISFSRGSSWPRDRTWVSHIIGRHFTIWVTREVLSLEINVFLEPQNVILFGNRVFVNVIKSRIHMKPYIIRVSPKSNENVLIRDRKGHMEKQGESHVNPHMMTKAKDWVKDQEHLEPSSAEKGKKGFPLETSKGV